MPKKGQKSNSKLDESKNEPKLDNSLIGDSLNQLSNIDTSNRVLKVNDIVWAKMKGYPFWPARITELVYKKNLNESLTDRKKTENELKEYKVVFFGGNTTGSVYKDNVKDFNCDEKADLIAKYSKNNKMTRSIEEAENFLKNLISFGKEKVENNLLSMEDELKLIKNAVDSKLEKVNGNSNKSLNEVQKSKNSSPLDSKKKLSIQIDKLCHKKEQRSSAIKAAKNLSVNSTPSQLKQQKEKISKLTGDDLDKLCSSAKKTYELIKSSTKPKEISSKKRNRSSDKNEKETENSRETSKKKCLYKQFESDDEELNFCIGKKDKLDSTNFSFSRSSSPVDLSLELEPSSNFKFSSMTLLIDSSMNIYTKYILKLFEIFALLVIESNSSSSIIIFDISDTNSDIYNAVESKLEEIKEKSESKIQLNVIHANELNKSTFDTDIIFSFIKQSKYDNIKFKNYEIFEKLVLGPDLNELKLVSFCPIDYEEVIIYHHHLSSNKGIFIEAPIVEFDNFQKVIVACLDEKFFKSIFFLFNSLFKAENLIFEGDDLGYPSIFCQSFKNYAPALKLFKMVSNKAINLIPQLMSVKCIDKKSQDLEMEGIKNKFKEKVGKGSLNFFNLYLENVQTEIQIENRNQLKLELNELLDNL